MVKASNLYQTIGKALTLSSISLFSVFKFFNNKFSRKLLRLPYLNYNAPFGENKKQESKTKQSCKQPATPSNLI